MPGPLLALLALKAKITTAALVGGTVAAVAVGGTTVALTTVAADRPADPSSTSATDGPSPTPGAAARPRASSTPRPVRTEDPDGSEAPEPAGSAPGTVVEGDDSSPVDPSPTAPCGREHGLAVSTTAHEGGDVVAAAHAHCDGPEATETPEPGDDGQGHGGAGRDAEHRSGEDHASPRPSTPPSRSASGDHGGGSGRPATTAPRTAEPSHAAASPRSSAPTRGDDDHHGGGSGGSGSGGGHRGGDGQDG